jgi:hypothetical protein
MITCTAAVLSLSLCVGSSMAQSLTALNDNEIEHGCGCSFHQPRQTTFKGTRILHWEDGSKARARLDGRLIKLDVGKPVTSVRQNQREKKGDKVTYRLQAGRTKIRANCVATVVCKPDDESCEATQYDAVLYVHNGKSSSTIKAWAICGC